MYIYNMSPTVEIWIPSEGESTRKVVLEEELKIEDGDVNIEADITEPEEDDPRN